MFLPVAIIVISGATAIYKSETSADLSLIRLSEDATVRVSSNTIKRIVQSITRDLAFLAEQETFIEMVSNGNGHRDLLIKDWQSFSHTKGIYDQIRWLDTEGQEQVRINYNGGEPISVPEHKLQNKRKRYYFTDTLPLNRGEFFISPLDLNIEQGKIERPIKPVIRIGTPVFNHEGEKRGIILLNYFGNELLRAFSQAMSDTDSHTWLINRDGYWLKGSNSNAEWGFMFNEPDLSLPALYTAAWQQINATEEGQFKDQHGLWTFNTIYPLIEGQKTSTGTNETFAASRSELASRDYYWKAVLLLPTDQYRATAHSLVLVTIALVGGLFFGSWRLATAWVREEKAQEKLRHVNEHLEETVASRTEDLRNEITVRQHAEEALRHREQRFRSITNTSSIAMIITVDHLGNVVTWNPAAERTFGYSESEVIGKPLTQVMPERYRSQHKQGLANAVSGQLTRVMDRTVEVHGLKKGGEEFPIELSLGTWKQDGKQYFSAVIHDISERRIAEEQLKHIANHDTLTGLPSRRLCLDRIKTAAATAKRDNNRAAVLFIDLDGFKGVNDTLGHEADDALLVNVSKRLTRCVREIDTVARIGGDEFVVVLFGLDNRESITHIAAKLIHALSQPFQLGDEEAVIGASIGIAIYPDDTDNSDLLLKLADEAMYCVKNTGKNSYQFYR
ncbi:diguanylate cyclase domain-containing protein [Solemya pervernicosa gill symbiont]|uniref:diguanylate cyclase domain-containing protein n=1 Tax=Solemya pervernicosa gill symbiont TaxID=642797 RepID=UPI001560C17F|nr:diguanylate cyclase [Solemya pervernicosa gill symbiont]